MHGDGRLGLPSPYQTGVSIMAKKAARRKAAGASKSRSTKGQKQTRSNKRAAAGGRASTRTGSKKRASSRPTRKKAAPPRPKSKSATTRSVQDLRNAGERAKLAASRRGGTGAERDLAQTPETGRSVRGRTNPMPTKRSTGTPAGAGTIRKAPGLERARKQLREVEEHLPTPPSSLDMDRRPSAARSGRHELQESRREHTEVSPDLTAGDVDADWEDAYAVGDEAPGGDNPTPDQDRVDDIGKALGVQYEDNEELKPADKISERDRHRWELDPASSDDYRDRD